MSGGRRRAHGPRELPLRALSMGAGRGAAVPTGTGGAIGTRGTFCLSCRHRDLSP